MLVEFELLLDELVLDELEIWFVKWKKKAESSLVRLTVGEVLPAVRTWIAVVTVMGRWKVTSCVDPAGTENASWSVTTELPQVTCIIQFEFTPSEEGLLIPYSIWIAPSTMLG